MADPRGDQDMQETTKLYTITTIIFSVIIFYWPCLLYKKDRLGAKQFSEFETLLQ